MRAFKWPYSSRIPNASVTRYSHCRAVGGGGKAQPSIFARSTTMLIIGIILAFVALAYLCWLLFALAVHALPSFAGLSAGLAAYHSGSGPIVAIIVGVIAGT